MRCFLASGWYPFLMMFVLGGVTALASALLKSDGSDVGNSQLVAIFSIGSSDAGLVIALFCLLLAFPLIGISRIIRLHNVALLHPAVVLRLQDLSKVKMI